MNARPYTGATELRRHRKFAIARTIVILLGYAAGNAIWSLPEVHRGNVRFEAPIGGRAIAADLLQGDFIDGVGPYRGEGTAIVADAQDGGFVVRFTGFRVSRGPDLHVWLVAHADPRNNRDVLTSEMMTLGPLKANSGAQSYPIPAGTDFSQYQSVVIWCKSVNSLFSSAALHESPIRSN